MVVTADTRIGTAIAAVKLGAEDYVVTFQSRVGRQEWLRPYTDETVEELGKAGLARLDVVCPGFAADCLETLEEIAMQNAEIFTDAVDDRGVRRLHRVDRRRGADQGQGFCGIRVLAHGEALLTDC